MDTTMTLDNEVLDISSLHARMGNVYHQPLPVHSFTNKRFTVNFRTPLVHRPNGGRHSVCTAGDFGFSPAAAAVKNLRHAKRQSKLPNLSHPKPLNSDHPHRADKHQYRTHRQRLAVI